MSYNVDRISKSGKLNQPCKITIEMQDISHAYNLIEALDAIVSEICINGDLTIKVNNDNGRADYIAYIGHDVEFKNLKLTIGE